MPNLEETTPAQPGTQAKILRNWGGLLLVAALVLTIAAAGFAEHLPALAPLGDLISLKTLGLNYGFLKDLVDRHFELAAMLYVAGYGLLGLLLLPGSSVFVVASGLFFGKAVGIPLVVAGSTLAAALGYCTGWFLLAGAVERWRNPAIEKLRAGFKRHAMSYMMFLRLTPGMPFAIINAVPALLGVRFVTFITGTVIGLLPSRIALATASAGLATAIARENEQYTGCLAAAGERHVCFYNIRISSLLTFEMIAALAVLALIALSPVLVDVVPKFWRSITGKPGPG